LLTFAFFIQTLLTLNSDLNYIQDYGAEQLASALKHNKVTNSVLPSHIDLSWLVYLDTSKIDTSYEQHLEETTRPFEDRRWQILFCASQTLLFWWKWTLLLWIGLILNYFIYISWKLYKTISQINYPKQLKVKIA
jgi:hypothetical protein